MTANFREQYFKKASEYYPRLYWVAYARLGNEEQARDAVQDAIVKGAKKINSFRNEAKITTWLTTILINHIRDMHRAKIRSKEEEFDPHADNFRDQRAGPDSKIERNELENSLMKIVDSLNSDYREIILLRYFSKLKLDEIAKLQKTSSGTVKSRLHQAKKIIKTKLLEAGFKGEDFDL